MFTKTTGYSFEETVGRNPRILKSGEQNAAFYEDMWKNIASGDVWHGEFHNKKKSGDLYWERAAIVPVKDGAGAVTHFVAVKPKFLPKTAS